MKVYEALASAFRKEGVTTVFGLMGNGNMHWWYAMDQAPDVKIHETRHEGSALTMAEGWARATGQPGCCTVTDGPGVTQLATALTVAARGRVPIVIFAGDSDLGNRSSFKYMDQQRLVESTGAGFIPLWKPEDTDDVVREAFFRTRTESRPIFVNAPRDVQQQNYHGDPDEYQPSTAMWPGPQRILPDPDRLREAGRMLAGSSKPVVVVGSGATQAGTEAAIKMLADRIGALLATTLPMKGWGNDSPYYAGIAGLYGTASSMELFSDADCVIGIGASLNDHTLAGGFIFPNARYIQIDVRPNLVMGNGRTADCFLQGDARLTVEALDALLAQERVSGTGYRTPEVCSALSKYDPDPREFELEPGTVDPRRAAALLDEALPAEVGVVLGNAHTSAFATYFMTKRRDVQWYCSAFGCIGQTLPTAIGGAVALPTPLAVIDGDASVMMHMVELDTAVRLRTKLLVAVLNDQALGAEYQKLVAKGLDSSSAVISTPDLGAVARAFGCRGRLITDLTDIKPAVEEFLAGDGPMLLDIRTSKTVISVPYRRTYYGEEI